MTYRADVAYLADCDPRMVAANAEEYQRLAQLIDKTMAELEQAKTTTQWEGGNRELFDQRVDETSTIFRVLRVGFVRAGTGLENFSPELQKAKDLFAHGDELGERLRTVIKPYLGGHTSTFDNAEPLRQWEDISHTTGFWDWWSDPISISDDVEAEANRLSNEIHQTYDEAKRIEETARAACVADLRGSFMLLTDFSRIPAEPTGPTESKPAEPKPAEPKPAEPKPAGPAEPTEPPPQPKTPETGQDPGARLPEKGEVPAPDDTTGSSPVSPELQDIRDRTAQLPDGDTTGDSSEPVAREPGTSESEEELKLRWIKDHKETILAASEQYGIPASVLAGIAYQELGGNLVTPDGAPGRAPENVLLGIFPGQVSGDPDSASYGPLAVQVSHAAESLGYDPSNLSEQQRNEIITSLKDTEENIFIAAKNLSDLKDSSDFASVDAAAMTAEQGQELAARYDGGPNWQGDQAQDYAQDYAAHQAKAAEALK